MGWETRKDETPSKISPWPVGPLSVEVTSPYVIGAFDIRYSDPKIIPTNSKFEIIGVKIYRAFDSEEGPYELITPTPVGALQHRDKTTNVLVTSEDETNNFLFKGDNEQKEYIFRTNFYPIVKEVGQAVAANRSGDIILKIDDGTGLKEVPAAKVVGETGEVYLITTGYYDQKLKKIIPARLPNFSQSPAVTCTYRYNSNLIRPDINRRIFYKVTSVAKKDSGFIETPLEEVKAETFFQMERIDWIWKEAIKRNAWILDQGGERAKAFIRKWFGVVCQDHITQYTRKQPLNDCKKCYGTGFVGGYEGPFDIIIAPPDRERNVELTDKGYRLNFAFDTWTGPSPLLSQRDFIVRQNNERYSVGPVTMAGQRGAYFQQSFELRYIDIKDIRYQVSISGGEVEIPKASPGREVPGLTDASPTITDKDGIPEKINEALRGRSVTYENIVF